MKIGVPAEVRPGETRVAATPETVKKLAAKNEVRVQAGAGIAASIRDGDYEAAGAKLVASAAEAYDADIVLKVRSPTEAEIGFLKDKSILVGLLDPYSASAFEAIARRGVTGFASASLGLAEGELGLLPVAYALPAARQNVRRLHVEPNRRWVGRQPRRCVERQLLGDMAQTLVQPELLAPVLVPQDPQAARRVDQVLQESLTGFADLRGHLR